MGTAELLDTKSKMCHTCWLEGWKDPTLICWKQSVESVSEGFRLKICMVQSSTAWYRDGQVNSDDVLPEEWFDPKGLESISFHSFWMGFHFENLNCLDDVDDPNSSDDEADSGQIFVRHVPR